MPMLESYRNAGIGFFFKLPATQTIPNEYWFGVSLTPINNDGSGITEPSPSTEYKRFKLPCNSATWNVATDGTVTNKSEIKLPELQSESGLATHFFISDSPTGPAIWWDEMVPPKPLAQYTTLYVNSGEAEFSIQNNASR